MNGKPLIILSLKMQHQNDVKRVICEVKNVVALIQTRKFYCVVQKIKLRSILSLCIEEISGNDKKIKLCYDKAPSDKPRVIMLTNTMDEETGTLYSYVGGPHFMENSEYVSSDPYDVTLIWLN